MKYLIVGLGNIGPEYAFTRHNAGFMVLDRLAAKENLSFKVDRLASVAEFKYKGRAITLIKPTTYMNLSGKALQHWMTALKVPVENVMILVDDLALPLGKLRIKPKGSSAGHNGLKNIEFVLGNDNYPRLKIGIGSDFPKGRQVDYVLGKFSDNDMLDLMPKLDKAIEMILSFCTVGIAPTMNFLNE
ncbi:MAG TPA: aminoacyl-tRNA hydrolase [Leadbetterella sp.]|nr:aminoacyl-tRNA hydrolase [Leadbetterella sp.]